MTAGANAGRFNSTNWTTAASVDANDYVEFTITPLASKEFSITSIVMLHQRSGTGPLAFTIRSSVDAYASDLTAPVLGADVLTTQTATFTFGVTSSTAAITYRIYAYSAEAGTGSWGPGDGAGNDIIVNGSTADVGASTSVSFSGTDLSVNESVGTVNLTLAISSFSSVQATSVEVALSSGDATRINGYTTQTVTWPANDGTNKTVTLTVTDDALCNGTAALVFTLQN
ncbi:MAG TPA: hypothetical protein P5248_07695, partial [Bacteroidales bacterium]|nr:hypothetical protein [Bacteroidales bacterium]